jgi:RHS repeat-associated protein
MLNGTWQSEYAIKDHLGNARVTFRDIDGNGFITASDITQEANYYPFGMQMEGDWSPAAVRIPYLYNGIEHVSDLGLNINTAFFRTLDPALGRWWQIDPKAEAFYGLSSYNSMTNNPVTAVDPAGDFAFAPLLAGMLVGAWFDMAAQVHTTGYVDWGRVAISAFAGAIGGAVSSGVGTALLGKGFSGFTTFLAGGSPQLATGGMAGMLSGAAGGFTGGFISGTINALSWRNWLLKNDVIIS